MFAWEPGSAEMPSASRPFTPSVVTQLVTRGVLIAPVTLHCGVSSLEADEDPYPELYDVPPATARLVNHVRADGGRVIAAGTTVVRALETAALRAACAGTVAAAGWTSHVVTPETGVTVVDGLLTGLHEPRSSHLRMLAAFADPDLLSRCYEAAITGGYLWHEFGDVHLHAAVAPCGSLAPAMTSPQTTLLITLTGRDRPGVTSRLFAMLARYPLTVTDIEQVVIRGRLVLGVLLDCDCAARPDRHPRRGYRAGRRPRPGGRDHDWVRRPRPIRRPGAGGCTSRCSAARWRPPPSPPSPGGSRPAGPTSTGSAGWPSAP